MKYYLYIWKAGFGVVSIYQFEEYEKALQLANLMYNEDKCTMFITHRETIGDMESFIGSFVDENGDFHYSHSLYQFGSL